MQLPFWDKWSQPQCSETLPQRLSACLCHARSRKFGVLKLSQCTWNKTQEHCAAGWANRLRHNHVNAGIWGMSGTHERRLFAPLWWLPGQWWVRTPSLGMRKWADTIFIPCPSSQTDFRVQHRDHSACLSHLHWALPFYILQVPFFLTRESEPESQQQWGPPPEDQHKPPSMHQVY